jgi:hypothetical protein
VEQWNRIGDPNTTVPYTTTKGRQILPSVLSEWANSTHVDTQSELTDLNAPKNQYKKKLLCDTFLVTSLNVQFLLSPDPVTLDDF